MGRNSHSPASAAEPSTETFQKHYGRGTGYPDEHSHHHGHPPPPHQSYPPSHYGASGQHHHPPPLPPLPPGHHGHGGPPPPPPGHGYHHHPSSWYYPPHAAAPSSSAAPPDRASSSRRSSSRASNKPASMPIPLVTPKSHDSETLPALPPVVDESSKVPAKKSPPKPSSKKSSKKKDSSAKLSTSNSEKEPEMEEEPKVDPMKQDFHFYAADYYEEIKQQCQQEVDDALADGSISKEKQLYLLTTLLNNRLIQNWEAAPASTRQEYLKKEEADRKRFMSEEEVASRHCATLTARRRSPKQSGALGRAGSFGLTSTLEMPVSSPKPEAGSLKRPNSELSDAEVLESAAKRLKAV